MIERGSSFRVSSVRLRRRCGGPALDYETTGKAVRRFEGDILGRASRQRDDARRLFVEGERTVSDYYNAERDYNEVVRQFYDSLIRHRRSMLRLNTAVGQRILP